MRWRFDCFVCGERWEEEHRFDEMRQAYITVVNGELWKTGQ